MILDSIYLYQNDWFKVFTELESEIVYINNNVLARAITLVIWI